MTLKLFIEINLTMSYVIICFYLSIKKYSQNMLCESWTW